MSRVLARIVAAQSSWAKPLSDRIHGPVHGLFHAMPGIRDLLNGRQLGHPLHAALTDLPIGVLGLGVVLDLLGDTQGGAWAIGLALLGMLASAAAGLADYGDTDGEARIRATVHGTIMTVVIVLVAAAFVVRDFLSGDDPGALGLGLEVVALGLVLAGAFVGGDVVYLLGNQVSRHAWRGGGAKWLVLEPAELDADGGIPEGRPVKAKLGINALVLVRNGATVLALHDQCAHAGGSLSTGTLADGCVECPIHGSRFRLADGAVVRGPSVYDQPTYEVRRAESGGWEGRRSQA
jgi:nitrite reductase/ring-hydroxylating ferredoxin subunit/uncharacterized membrane protein